ncbi:IS66 family insertion sequence element accessory protein TnpA [Burkholderia ubonensis]|uniref:IS66 family insertion sequence element accessory protein TnpA n=1 Tax=Burkholderia ubonensis TaxID=101571 RepID=UPI0009B2EC44
MQETEKLPGDSADVRSPPARRRRNRGTRPWREVIGEFRASGLTIQAYSERSGISRSSMTRYLALARQAERSGDAQQNAGATVAVAQTMAGFMRVGIVDRAVGGTGNVNSCDVPELILGDGVRLRLPAYTLEPLLQAMIDRIGAGPR